MRVVQELSSSDSLRPGVLLGGDANDIFQVYPDWNTYAHGDQGFQKWRPQFGLLNPHLGSSVSSLKAPTCDYNSAPTELSTIRQSGLFILGA